MAQSPNSPNAPNQSIDSKTFQSTHIQSASYRASDGSLKITFTNGRTYLSTTPIPSKLWSDFKRSDSPGNYFKTAIEPIWEGEELSN